jgi:hypothetical protein
VNSSSGEQRKSSIGAVVVEAPKHRRELRRHKDDDYVDRVVVQASNDAQLVGYIVPRYKTSYMSGDEWRIHAQMELRLHPEGQPVFKRGFGRMDGLETYAALFIREAPHFMNAPSATLSAYRKGHVLMRQTFPTFGEAVIGLKWHIVTCNEGSEIEWCHVSDAQEARHCQQVGCAEPPINVFRYKKLFYGSSDPARTFLPPKHDFERQWTWYCARHTQRGDCGFEDADKNLELVEDPGIARPRAGDLSPSGLVVLGDDKEPGP